MRYTTNINEMEFVRERVNAKYNCFRKSQLIRTPPTIGFVELFIRRWKLREHGLLARSTEEHPHRLWQSGGRRGVVGKVTQDAG